MLKLMLWGGRDPSHTTLKLYDTSWFQWLFIAMHLREPEAVYWGGAGCGWY